MLNRKPYSDEVPARPRLCFKDVAMHGCEHCGSSKLSRGSVVFLLESHNLFFKIKQGIIMPPIIIP